MSDAVKLYGVLVTFDRVDALKESLAVLTRQTRRLDTLVVIDNAPRADVEAVVTASGAADRVRYVASQENLGPAGGIALGMQLCLVEASDDDWLCILDDDDPIWRDDVLAEYLAIAASSDTQVAGVGGGGAVFDWTQGRLRGVAPTEESHQVDADYLKSDWCPLYRIATVRSVGPFDGKLFFGFDDLEFGLRVRAAGWRLIACDREGATPSTAGPSWRVGPSDWRRYYALRNLIFLLRAHGNTMSALRVSVVTGVAKPLVSLFVSPKLALWHLGQNVRAIRDGWFGRLGRTVTPGSGRRPGKPAAVRTE